MAGGISLNLSGWTDRRKKAPSLLWHACSGGMSEEYRSDESGICDISDLTSFFCHVRKAKDRTYG